MMDVPAGRALLLDLDGTLAKSLGVLEGVYFKFLAHFGREGSPAEFARLNGPAFAEVIAALKAAHNLAPSVDDLRAIYLDLIAHGYDAVEPNDGARALLRAARDAGWKTGVVTSNMRVIVSRWLERTGLAPWVTTVTTSEMVAAGKPAPDIYLKALEQTGCVATRSCAVEDSPTGAASAVNAGLKTYVLKNTGHTSAPWPAGVEEIGRLDDLIARVMSP
jgi:HAD superfamily hydrolase (TIGR01509 family)